MAESLEYVKNAKNDGKEIIAFIKKSTKLSAKEAKKLRNKLEDLNLMKLDEKQISKIIDILPENTEELNKIFVGISLDEDETKKVIDITKEFK